MKEFRAPAPLFACLMLTGCSLFGFEASLRVRLPELPGHWRESLTPRDWLLRFPAPGGGLKTCILAAERKEALLRVPKQRNLPVSAALLLSSGLRLPAAGGVYPLDLDLNPDTVRDSGQLDLSWKNGMLAELLLKLIAGGVDVAGLNSRRLSEEIWARSGGDPWRLDMNVMAEALAAEDLSVYAIRLLPACSGKVYPGEGFWFLESPFALPGEAGGDGGLELVDLPAGRHVLFALGGEARYLLSVWEEGEFLLVPAGP